MVIPPDGGYGWIIVIFSFFCQVIVDGIVFSGGVLLKYIGKEFNAAPWHVVLIVSLQVGNNHEKSYKWIHLEVVTFIVNVITKGCYFLAGTISSAIINKYGFRPVAVMGCLISFVTLMISSFSVNLVMMIFFYSIIGNYIV